MNKQEVIRKIDTLRKILNNQIKNEENFDKIIETSQKIDVLIKIYYKIATH